MRLQAEEGRVLGALVEKQLTTPQQYPLTMPSLVAACNQTTNRDPIVTYDEATISSAIDELKKLRLVRSVLPSHGRSAVRYRHVLDETLALDQRQSALLSVLLLRGPQTLGELRTRTDRMAEFDSLSDIVHELEFLAGREEPLVSRHERRPGQKEERWATPLVAPVQTEQPPPTTWPEPAREPAHEPTREPSSSTADSARPNDPVGALRDEMAELRAEVHELRDELRLLRASLGG